MKKSVCLFLGVLLVITVTSGGALFAQTPSKKSLPQVPITYPGDTDQAIIRRVQWIEGAKKEATLVWWFTMQMNFMKLDKRVYSKFGDLAVPGNSVMVPAYNTKLVAAADAPKSWEDLLNPQWKGRIGLSTMMQIWTTLAVAEGGWGLEKTEDFLRRLKQQQPVWARSHGEARTLLIAGEFKVLAEEMMPQFLAAQDKGAPIQWIRANPAVVVGAAFVLPVKAPHPNSASLFLEWLFSPAGLVLFEQLSDKGLPYPGSGTRQSKLVEGLDLCVRTEEAELKSVEMNLDKRFGDILGVTPGQE